ncbi:hypothetical protein P7K49_038348, partial [Saguinus oedipus]
RTSVSSKIQQTIGLFARFSGLEPESLLEIETLTLCHLKLAVNSRAEMEIGRYHWMYPGSKNHQYHPVPTLGDRASPLSSPEKPLSIAPEEFSPLVEQFPVKALQLDLCASDPTETKGCTAARATACDNAVGAWPEVVCKCILCLLNDHNLFTFPKPRLSENS